MQNDTAYACYSPSNKLDTVADNKNQKFIDARKTLVAIIVTF